MTIYEKNMEALKQKYQIIYDAIKDVRADELLDIVHIENARNGGKIIVYNADGKQVYLNSKYDPENEAAKYMKETLEMPDSAVLIMFGLSNALYIKEHIKNAKNNTRCIIFEPSMEVFMQVISHIDISDIIESERICLIVKDVNTEIFSTIVGDWIDMGNKDANKIMAAPKYVDSFHEGYEEFRLNCMEMYEKLYLIANTVVEHGTREVENELYNMKYLIGCRCGAELKGMFADDMPAIVVSAGPSLEKNVELLKEAKGKAFIFVVDSAISKVMELGIKPDAIISIDRGKAVEKFKIDGIDEVPFFVHISSNTDVLNCVKPQKLFFFSSDSKIWNDLFSKMGKEMDSMDMGGSVATAAIANLISWGIKRIILIGQDLSFTGNRMHAGEGTIEISEDDDWYMTVKSVDGEDVFIRKDYYIFLKWIEEVALRFKDIEFIDATEGGAVKKNLTYMTLREVIDKYCKSEYNVEKILSSVPTLFEGNDRQLIIEALEKMKRDFQNMRKQLIYCKADCIKGKKILESNVGNLNEINRINKNIVKTVNMIRKSDESDCIYKWTAETEFNMLKNNNADDNSQESAIQKCERNAKYFGELADAMPELINIVEECLLEIRQ